MVFGRRETNIINQLRDAAPRFMALIDVHGHFFRTVNPLVVGSIPTRGASEISKLARNLTRLLRQEPSRPLQFRCSLSCGARGLA